jgi:hypothetical protein
MVLNAKESFLSTIIEMKNKEPLWDGKVSTMEEGWSR